jgi:hypothetical protein
MPTVQSKLPQFPRQVLIVCPRFAPTNAPDMHRVRLALPWLTELGWSATILCVEPQYVPVPQDPLLNKSIPSTVRVVRVPAIPLSRTRPIGIGSLAFRAMLGIRRAGDWLLSKERFDLIYFSTTEFGVFPLGPRWLQRHRVPYVLDYQDPWITDYYRRNRICPPGGKLKHSLMQMLARWYEPTCVQQASAITVVSKTYADQLQERYRFPIDRMHVIPFGGANTDFDIARNGKIRHGVFEPGDGSEHWVYAGVAGPYMTKSLTALFRAFRSALNDSPDRFGRIRMHFVGTDYAPAEIVKAQVMPIAESESVAPWVHEIPTRLPYFAALQCLLDADALIVPGSNDPGYTASKIFPYVLAKRPLLTIFHRNSSVNRIVDDCHAGRCIPFDELTSIDDLSLNIRNGWFLNGQYLTASNTNWEAFRQFDSETMANKLTSIFTTIAEAGR